MEGFSYGGKNNRVVNASEEEEDKYSNCLFLQIVYD